MKQNRLIIIYSFAVCLFLMVIGLFSAKNTSQLLNSFIYLPLIFYFGIKLLHTKSKSKNLNSEVNLPQENKVSPSLRGDKVDVAIQSPDISTSAVTPEEVVGVPDHNKRIFLKLIGSAGFSLLLMALFTKKAQASFFGSAPLGPGIVSLKDSAGKVIDPAEKKPTDGYEVSSIDDAGTPAYYGFIKKGGAWYILKNTSGNFLYAKGTSDYATNWTARASLTYDYYNNVFS